MSVQICSCGESVDSDYNVENSCVFCGECFCCPCLEELKRNENGEYLCEDCNGNKSHYSHALNKIHSILADFYDEELERNENNAKKNVSRTIRILKERIDKLHNSLMDKK